MDHRRRSNQNAVPHGYSQHPVAVPPDPNFSPRAYYGNEGVGHYPAASYPVPVSPGPAYPGPAYPDARWLYAETSRLRQLLGATQSQYTHQLQTIRQQTEQSLSQQKQLLTQEIQSLIDHVETLKDQANQATTRHKQELSAVKAELEREKSAHQAASDQVVALNQELENLALTASTEQQELKQQQRSIVQRYDATLSEKSATIDELRSQITDQHAILHHWKIAQDQAVSLSEWYEIEHQKERRKLIQVREDYERFRSRTSEAFALCEDEIETLDATVAMLRTDHEAVELINADLDHQNDELQCNLQHLQRDLQGVLAESARDQQQSKFAIEALVTKLQETKTRLISTSEEKTSLVETIAKLRIKSDEFDASLFAKDQELAATKKLAAEAQRQLDHLRREHETISNQNETMRTRIRESTNSITGLEKELADAKERVQIAENSLAQRDHQIREFQSAARAAEANAMLRANEAEQQYVIELQRLETELERHKESENQRSKLDSDYEGRIGELEHALAASKRSANASAQENDRLQRTIENLNERIIQFESMSDAKRDRIELLEATIVQMQSDTAIDAEEIGQLRRDLADRRAKMAELADRVATQQNRIAQQEQELADSIMRLEEAQQATNNPGLDEHYQQQLTAQQQVIHSLQDTIRKLEAEMIKATETYDESQLTIRNLESQLTDWKRHENPLNEVKRLSAELARQTAEHSRERDALIHRIEQLQTFQRATRAA